MSIGTGELWAVVHIIFSVCLLGNLISDFDTLREERRNTLQRVQQLTRTLDSNLLTSVIEHVHDFRPDDATVDSVGVNASEFVLAIPDRHHSQSHCIASGCGCIVRRPFRSPVTSLACECMHQTGRTRLARSSSSLAAPTPM